MDYNFSLVLYHNILFFQDTRTGEATAILRACDLPDDGRQNLGNLILLRGNQGFVGEIPLQGIRDCERVFQSDNFKLVLPEPSGTGEAPFIARDIRAKNFIEGDTVVFRLNPDLPDNSWVERATQANLKEAYEEIAGKAALDLVFRMIEAKFPGDAISEFVEFGEEFFGSPWRIILDEGKKRYGHQ